MTTSNDFSKYYRTISNTELLSILENSSDYQPSAVEAAKKEFSDRRLSETEIKEAREALLAIQLQTKKQREKVKVIEDKVKNAGHTLIETLNPIQPGIPSTEKTIRLIAIVFGGLFLYEIISDFQMHLAFLKDIPRFPLESILYLLPLIFLPIAIFTFWKRKSIGWILLVIFLTFSCAIALGSLVDSLTWKSSGNEFLDTLFPRTSPTTYIIRLVFLIGTIYVLCKQNIRKEFSIHTQKMAATIGVTAFVTLLLKFAI